MKKEGHSQWQLVDPGLSIRYTKNREEGLDD
jgi:hypothetical protein